MKIHWKKKSASAYEGYVWWTGMDAEEGTEDLYATVAEIYKDGSGTVTLHMDDVLRKLRRVWGNQDVDYFLEVIGSDSFTHEGFIAADNINHAKTTANWLYEWFIGELLISEGFDPGKSK
jgi:hypothetical protein